MMATIFLICGTLASQPQTSQPASESPQPSTSSPATPKDRIAQAIARGIEHLLATQEGDDRAEWPYEGVYRVAGQIPIGYRIGGTAICSIALMDAPGFAGDAQRQEAIGRALKFVIDGASQPLMSPDYDGGYDVRGWGYTYGLALLLRAKALNATPAALTESSEATIRFYIDAIAKTAVPKVGGWNYARLKGKDAVSPPSPFMTAPTLQVLFEARRQGFDVDESVVERALATLEGARTPSGSFRYSGIDGAKSKEAVPGAVGRMLACEVTLHQAGRSSVANIRGAVDAFIVHWEWLNQRRAKPGTHMPPYNIAPYYFYYAHYYAAMAVEQLPENERGEYRRRINELLFCTQGPDGTWNDRVFTRTSNYGTAMAMLALMMPQLPPLAQWMQEPATSASDR